MWVGCSLYYLYFSLKMDVGSAKMSKEAVRKGT